MSDAVAITEKKCSRCGVVKPVGEFTKAYNRPRASCLPCDSEKARERRAANRQKFRQYAKERLRKIDPQKLKEQRRKQYLRRYHGLDVATYDRLHTDQAGLCAICRQEATNFGGKPLAIDHDHKTGQVRGLLCFRCNLALGLLEDNTDLILAIALYLEKHRAVVVGVRSDHPQDPATVA